MNATERVRVFLDDLAPLHRPKPGADLDRKHYGHTLRLLTDFWAKSGQGIEKAFRKERADLKKAVGSAVSSLSTWLKQASSEYFAVLTSDGYSEDALKCVRAWAKAWNLYLHEFSEDPLARPLVSVGAPPIQGDYHPSHPDAPWTSFRGIFGEPGSTNVWPDEVRPPQRFRSVANLLNGTPRADWNTCGGDVPREFNDALSLQARSKWAAWRATDALLGCRNSQSFWEAQKWAEAVATIVFEWSSLTQPDDNVAEPLLLFERRPSPGDADSRLDLGLPWLQDWWKSGAPPSSRDAESFVLCVSALMAHLADPAPATEPPPVSDKPGPVKVSIRYDNSRRSKPWVIDVNGDSDTFTVGPAAFLRRLHLEGQCRGDGRHVKILTERFVLLDKCITSASKSLKNDRQYQALPLRDAVAMSESDAALLAERSKSASRGAAARKRKRNS